MPWCEHDCKPKKEKIGIVTTVGCPHVAIAYWPNKKKEIEMGVKNGYLKIRPVKQSGMISSEGNVYQVIDSSLYEFENNPSYRNFYIGEKIVVDSEFVIRINVEGKDCHYVKEEHVMETIHGSEMHD